MTIEIHTMADVMLAERTDAAFFEIELLDLETWEVPRRLSDEDRREHTGSEGRRRSRTETEQDDDR